MVATPRILLIPIVTMLLSALGPLIPAGAGPQEGRSRGPLVGLEEQTWWVQFRLFSSTVEPDSSMDDILRTAVECPVAPELYQRTDSDSLRGLISVLTLGEGEESLTAIMQLSDDLIVADFQPGAWNIKVYIPDGRFRVVLLPDPFFWTPSIVSQKKVIDDDHEFSITGFLNLVDRSGDVTFPPKVTSETVIRFERVKAEGAETALGFSAFVDFEVAGGKLVNRDLKLVVDRDGDGRPDQVIAGGPYVAPAPKE